MATVLRGSGVRFGVWFRLSTFEKQATTTAATAGLSLLPAIADTSPATQAASGASREVPAPFSAWRPRCAVRRCQSPDDPASAFVRPCGFPPRPLQDRAFGPTWAGLRRLGLWFARLLAGAASAGHSPPVSSRAAFQACAARTARPCPHDRTRATLLGFTPFAVLSRPAGHRRRSPSRTPHLPSSERPPRCFFFEEPVAQFRI